MRDVLHRLEDSWASLLLAAVVLLPLGEMVARGFGSGIPGSAALLAASTLWIAFLGAAVAARERKLLSLATGEMLPAGAWRTSAHLVANSVGAGVCGLLTVAAWHLVTVDRELGEIAFFRVPSWVVQLVLPFSFLLIALRLAWQSSTRAWLRLVPFAVILAGVWLGLPEIWPDAAETLSEANFARLNGLRGLVEEGPFWPWLAVLVVATLLGGPLFVALGGVAVLLFLADGIPAVAVAAEAARSITPHVPAIPLFTLTGFLLAEGKAAERLLAVFRSWMGWMPGGTAVVCAILCAFLTVFTGGSGVTILVLGGLLLPALRKDGYSERFGLGLLTSSGCLGLLFPPALPLILYGIIANQPMEEMFIGGIFPGILLVLLVAGLGVREGIRRRVPRVRFEWRTALLASWRAKWELLLPLVVLVAVFGGFATLVESAAVAAFAAFFIQVVIRREVKLGGQLLRVFRECLVLMGGVLVILAVSTGLTNYLVDAQVPMRLLEWVQEHIESRHVFLLALNVFLLVVGCLMDIFSATVVVVPLIVPIGAAFGVDPVHLGIIFIANLELGYLTPPVGLNLFLASYRFDKPLFTIYRAALPMLLALAFGVLLITYLPFLSTGILGWWRSG